MLLSHYILGALLIAVSVVTCAPQANISSSAVNTTERRNRWWFTFLPPFYEEQGRQWNSLCTFRLSDQQCMNMPLTSFGCRAIEQEKWHLSNPTLFRYPGSPGRRERYTNGCHRRLATGNRPIGAGDRTRRVLQREMGMCVHRRG